MTREKVGIMKGKAGVTMQERYDFNKPGQARDACSAAGRVYYPPEGADPQQHKKLQ